jgi:hypothetical protein
MTHAGLEELQSTARTEKLNEISQSRRRRFLARLYLASPHPARAKPENPRPHAGEAEYLRWLIRIQADDPRPVITGEASASS